MCAFAYHVYVMFVSSRKIACEERLFSPAKLYAKSKTESVTFLSRKVVLCLPEEDLKLMLTEELVGIIYQEGGNVQNCAGVLSRAVLL